MNKGLKSRGYTIVELMIVLAITGALLVSVMMGIAAQQRKTEFSQSINDTQAQVNDVINTVATGYSVNTGNFTCTSIGNGPQLSSGGGNSQGSNQDCIIYGRAFQYNVDSDPGTYNIYTVLGQRQTNSGNEVTTPAEAMPKIAAASNGGQNSFETAQIRGGVTVTKMIYTTDGTLATAQPVGGFAFLNSLGRYTGCTNLCSGSSTVLLYAVTGSSLNTTESTFTNVSSGLNAARLLAIPNGSVMICLKSGGTDQYGVITVGSNGRQLTTKLDVLSGAEATGPPDSANSAIGACA